VRLLIVDDLHFLRRSSTSGVEVSNHFKYIANEYPVTLVFMGVGLAERGLLDKVDSVTSPVLAQSGRRTTRLGMAPFLIDTAAHRRQWRALLLAIEQRLVFGPSPSGHALRRVVRLSVRPLHRPYRVADDVDQQGLSARRAYRGRTPRHDCAGCREE
jgi:hypothetical protein